MTGILKGDYVRHKHYPGIPAVKVVGFAVTSFDERVLYVEWEHKYEMWPESKCQRMTDTQIRGVLSAN